MTQKPKLRGQIEPMVGEQYRFLCPSDTLGVEPYLVDLEANFGNGVCTCADFQIKKRASGCKHLKRCWIYYAIREIKCQVVAKHKLHKRYEDE